MGQSSRAVLEPDSVTGPSREDHWSKAAGSPHAEKHQLQGAQAELAAASQRDTCLRTGSLLEKQQQDLTSAGGRRKRSSEDTLAEAAATATRLSPPQAPASDAAPSKASVLPARAKSPAQAEAAVVSAWETTPKTIAITRTDAQAAASLRLKAGPEIRVEAPAQMRATACTAAQAVADARDEARLTLRPAIHTQADAKTRADAKDGAEAATTGRHHPTAAAMETEGSHTRQQQAHFTQGLTQMRLPSLFRGHPANAMLHSRSAEEPAAGGLNVAMASGSRNEPGLCQDTLEASGRDAGEHGDRGVQGESPVTALDHHPWQCCMQKQCNCF